MMSGKKPCHSSLFVRNFVWDEPVGSTPLPSSHSSSRESASQTSSHDESLRRATRSGEKRGHPVILLSFCNV